MKYSIHTLWLPALAVFAAACADSPSGPTGAAADASASASREAPPHAGGPVRTATLAQALSQDAGSYAVRHNVSLVEAVRRLEAQGDQGETVSLLRAANPDRFAGLWLEHAPEFRLIVRLVGNDPAGPEFQAAAAGSPTPVVFVTGAAATESQVLGRIQASMHRFRAVFPEMMGTDHDVRNGEIVLTVFAKGARGQSAQARGAALTRQVGHPVRVQVVEARERNQHTRGGAHLSTCTSGFVVANSAGTRGVTTAAHCGNTQTYFEYAGENYPATFVAERLDADEDVQWHTTTHDEYPEFYADLTTTARVLTGRRLRSSTAVGNTVCHRGKTTGYSCGSVESTTYQPTFAGACGSVACAATYIKVSGPDLRCDGGDSGGPWFNGQTAFGTHKTGASSGPGTGQCSFATYMSTDYLTGLGVSLVYGT
jgi:streptogrisin C